jgi:outer membrane immunogenic protein
MSKLRVALAAIAVAVASPAAAADLARPYYGNAVQPVQPSLLPGFVWTGLYAGAQAGYMWSTTDWDQTGSFKMNDVSGGVHVGYNWQVGQIVYGVEGQANWSGADGSKTCTTGICSAEMNWNTDLRLRAGYAFDRANIFGAAGIALASFKTAETATPSSGDANVLGFTLGVGGEYAVTQNIIAGVEYKHTWYGDDNVKTSITGADLSTGVLQARISYKF